MQNDASNSLTSTKSEQHHSHAQTIPYNRPHYSGVVQALLMTGVRPDPA
jgi:hypothetical protein